MRRLFQLLLSIRRYDKTPVEWQHSMSFQIDKCNGKSGCEAVRLINTLDAVGKAFYLHIWRSGNVDVCRPYAYGYARGRSRLEAIAQQNITSWRLRHSRISHVTSFFDVANAFYSPHQVELDRIIDDNFSLNDAPLLKQRHQQAVVAVDASDGLLHIHTGSGALQVMRMHLNYSWLCIIHGWISGWSTRVS